MRVLSYAKINWSLRITAKRPDGYHDLETLFQTVSLHDILTFHSAEALEVTCSDPTIPTGETNLVTRAARALGVTGVAIHIEKWIPAGGGLGGGSSNAAATLLALDRMFRLNTPPARLSELALALGSDVPFFLLGGTAYATGRGEVITPLEDAPPVSLLLIMPPERVPTADAFREIKAYSPPSGLDVYRAALRGSFPSRDDGVLVNDFERPVFARLPQLAGYKRQLLESGAKWAAMSGSGSTIVGAFASASDRDRAMRTMRGVRTVAAETVRRELSQEWEA